MAGLESLIGTEILRGAWSFPLRATYTLNVSEFQTGFRSDNPQWGIVEAGDELPYLPRHQVSAQAGVAHTRWSLDAGFRYTSRMRDVAGQSDDDLFTDDSMILDLAARYDFGQAGQIYGTVNNLLDQANIVARRPIGARPGVPRLVVIDYRNQF